MQRHYSSKNSRARAYISPTRLAVMDGLRVLRMSPRPSFWSFRFDMFGNAERRIISAFSPIASSMHSLVLCVTLHIYSRISRTCSWSSQKV